MKDNQPILHETIAALCESAEPQATTCTIDTNERLRHETRRYEIFLPGKALADSPWHEHVASIVRVKRSTNKRSAATGLWQRTEETAFYVCDIVPAAKEAAAAIRGHWGIENRAHYVRDVSFAEDASRIRKNPGVFARLRSFALNILRFNHIENIAETRYRLAIGGIAALTSMRFM